jgi:hypothetical protein
MKVYKQMKMYNDPSTNPILYKNEKWKMKSHITFFHTR